MLLKDGSPVPSWREVCRENKTAVSARGYNIRISISPAYLQSFAVETKPARTVSKT